MLIFIPPTFLEPYQTIKHWLRYFCVLLLSAESARAVAWLIQFEYTTLYFLNYSHTPHWQGWRSLQVMKMTVFVQNSSWYFEEKVAVCLWFTGFTEKKPLCVCQCRVTLYVRIFENQFSPWLGGGSSHMYKMASAVWCTSSDGSNQFIRMERRLSRQSAMRQHK